MDVLKTGYEVYKKNGEVDLQQSIDLMIEKLEIRNPWKYKSFLAGLQKLKTILRFLRVKKSKERAQVVNLVYFAMRLLDDIVDGDAPVMIPPEIRPGIVEEKKQTMQWLIELNKEDLFDVITEEIFRVSDKTGVRELVIQGVVELTDSILFDAHRIAEWHKTKKLQLIPKEKLQNNFHKMDVRGTTYSTAALFWLEPACATDLLEPLGNATRIAYTLTDLLEDPKNGLCNIPLEDIEQFEITPHDLDVRVKANHLEELPDSIKEWCAHMIGEMEHDLSQYYANMETYDIPLRYTNNELIAYAYNTVLKKLIFPKGYISDIIATKKLYKDIIAV